MKLDDNSLERMFSVDPSALPPDVRHNVFGAIRSFAEASRAAGRAEGVCCGIALMSLIAVLLHAIMAWAGRANSIDGVIGFGVLFILFTILFSRVEVLNNREMYGDEKS